MKIIIRILQLAFALVFIFSGLAKCIDPTGTSIKFGEYLQYFGWNWMLEFTMGMAWVLSILEFFVGFNLLMGRAVRQALLLATFMMLVFTPLTLWLACTDAIQDCGCFGDAIHLSNWATFAKNLVLDVVLVLLIVYRKLLYSLVGKTNFSVYAYWCLFIVGALCWMGTFRDPLIDFRPFLHGVNVADGVLGRLSDTDEEAVDEITYTCIYERDGVQKEFPLEEIPDEADGWTFVETIEHSANKDNNVSATKEESLHLDFFARTEDGELFTEDLLRAPGYTFLLLSASIKDASQHDIDRIEQLYEYSMDQQYAFYCLTSRDTTEVAKWKFLTGAEYPFLYTDMQIIETITRANPAVVLLRDGVLCWKENLATLDVKAIVSDKLDEQTYGEINEIDYHKRFLALMILLFGPLPLSLCFEIPRFIKLFKKEGRK